MSEGCEAGSRVVYRWGAGEEGEGRTPRPRHAGNFSKNDYLPASLPKYQGMHTNIMELRKGGTSSMHVGRSGTYAPRHGHA